MKFKVKADRPIYFEDKSGRYQGIPGSVVQSSEDLAAKYEGKFERVADDTPITHPMKNFAASKR